MKRARRWAFNMLAGASGILCVFVLSLWILSYWWEVGVKREARITVGGVQQAWVATYSSSRGRCGYNFIEVRFPRVPRVGGPFPDGDTGWQRYAGQEPHGHRFLVGAEGSFFGFVAASGEERLVPTLDLTRSQRLVVIPYWPFAALLVVAPLIWLRETCAPPPAAAPNAVPSVAIFYKGGVDDAQDAVVHPVRPHCRVQPHS